ncbi:MAG: hypothetical protein K0U76_09185 [Actinomycetia bacterium]|nr:hypothetical protein [Actinomycetes bacterium]
MAQSHHAAGARGVRIAHTAGRDGQVAVDGVERLGAVHAGIDEQLFGHLDGQAIDVGDETGGDPGPRVGPKVRRTLHRV